MTPRLYDPYGRPITIPPPRAGWPPRDPAARTRIKALGYLLFGTDGGPSPGAVLWAALCGDPEARDQLLRRPHGARALALLLDSEATP